MAANDLNPDELNGTQKAAIFLLAMGEEFTSNFFKRLEEKEIKEIGRHMTEISYVPSEVLKAVFEEFIENFENDVNVCVSGRSFLEDIVAKTLDDETARRVYEAIGNKDTRIPFSELAYIPSNKLVNILKGEHPQTAALVLSYLPREKSAEILSLFPENIKADIALRVVQIDHVQEDLIRDLDEAIQADLAVVGTSTTKINGIETLANILNEVDGKTEEYVLSHIEEENGDLAEKIRQKMFVFEDLLQVDDRSFREILQNIDNQEVIKALKTASEEMKEKIFKNLSERAAQMLKEDMEVMGPVKLREVEEAQQSILRTAKRLEGEGKIVLAGKGKEDVLV